MPHNENMRSTYACEAGAARRSSASGASCLYVCRRCFQKSKATTGTVKDESWISDRYWLIWLCADSTAPEWTVDTDRAACCWVDILLARNLNLCNNTVEWIWVCWLCSLCCCPELVEAVSSFRFSQLPVCHKLYHFCPLQLCIQTCLCLCYIWSNPIFHSHAFCLTKAELNWSWFCNYYHNLIADSSNSNIL